MIARSRTFIYPRSHSSQKRMCFYRPDIPRAALGLRLYQRSPTRYLRSHMAPVSHQQSSRPASFIAACAKHAKKQKIPAVCWICRKGQVSPHSGTYTCAPNQPVTVQLRNLLRLLICPAEYHQKRFPREVQIQVSLCYDL